MMKLNCIKYYVLKLTAEHVLMIYLSFSIARIERECNSVEITLRK